MVEISNLNFAYKNKPNLFSGLQLKISEGSIYGLLGKNGAGKTTLLKIISGLLFPQQGDCTVFGFNSLPFYPQFDQNALEQHIATFTLPGNERLTSMSYGQKKKFLIAFGLATNCKLLILDEPTNGLDIPSKSQLRKLLAASLDENRTIIISTHQVRDIGNLIDPIVILDEGNIIFDQSIDAISRKLAVNFQKDEPDSQAVLYSEKTLGGYVVIEENGGQSESNLHFRSGGIDENKPDF